MASQVHAQIVKAVEIFWHKEYNAARLSGDYGSGPEMDKIRTSLVREGWRMNGDGVLEVEKISEDWHNRAVAELTAKWEDLKEKSKTDVKIRPFKDVFEATRIKNGKLLAPKYMGVSGNRRASVLEAANVARYTAEPPLDLITEIPVIIQTFASEKDRIVAQVLENMGKLEGFTKPSERDMLLSAKLILERGGIQDDLRRAFTATTGQKLYGLLILNKRFPTVRLLDRMVNTDPTDPSFIRYGPIKGARLPNLVLRSDPKELQKFNDKERTSGKQELTPLTAEGLEEFLGTKTVNEPKIMERKSIAGLAENFPEDSVRDAAKAVINNNVDVLNKYLARATLLNGVNSLCDKGVTPDLEAIILALTKAQDLAVAIKAIKAALKV